MGGKAQKYIYILFFLGIYILLTILRTLRLGTTELCNQGKIKVGSQRWQVQYKCFKGWLNTSKNGIVSYGFNMQLKKKKEAKWRQGYSQIALR